ncbi:hypothetical protein I7I50_00086 [Histoplasma capsulatum G186AR]|uniref:Uncharacterized protein n=1 Tax=Ajellomyces capsulatus TaxID=5037 RepID=A0A8H8CUI3_AJECA|nr:hypothetical protein I7I52_07355 [Histoplasma capsulatum]QSS72287.1 hypothetical protein I7I50_00086 [Histoplasma capsulatum G186AR]
MPPQMPQAKPTPPPPPIPKSKYRSTSGTKTTSSVPSCLPPTAVPAGSGRW